MSDEDQGDLQALAGKLFTRTHGNLFMLTVDCDEEDLPAFCADLFLHGVRRLHGPDAANDPTILTQDEFSEVARCMLRAGVEVTVGPLVGRPKPLDPMSKVVEGKGGTFLITFRTSRPR